MKTVRTVLYVANSSLIGGANRVLMDMISGLDRARFRPVLACPSEGPLHDWARNLKIPVTIVPASTGDARSELLRAGRLASLIMRTRAALIHAIDPTCYRAASWAAALTGALRVCHIQFPPSVEALRWLFRVKPHLAISCYQGHVAELVGEIPELQDVLTSLPNAVRDDAFVPVSASGGASPWRFGRSRMVLIVGHLSDIKGHPTFLKAAAIIRQQFPDCAFVALGGETIQIGFQRELEALAATLGIADDVHFLGWRQNVAEIVAAADVFALPSLKEGLPLAMLEAMACSVPVVATPVNGIPEVVRNGVNGTLVPVNDPARLAEAILPLLRDPAAAAALGRAGRETVQREFSMSRFVSELQGMYDGLLAGRPVAFERRHTARRLPILTRA